ncbi:hypothetical protein [Marilutibacter spongiae]|uniref:Uncharacterized protein n=1 Tax=Marilutibacter spongiae TaxID=2025720 RepID=A0A7W3Y6M8_9GAMM|nr:hypothetical protein [Lysobacter spongiae]MBB1061412.1 hypothetical protein [Lysobacter spongiae]
MTTTRGVLLLCALGLGAWSQANAQTAAEGCPILPASTGLTWEYSSAGDADFCRALREDGSEAFGMYISKKPGFEPKRSDREEEGRVDGQQIHWYRSELAGKPDIIARETLVKVGRDRTAHIWVQAESQDRLNQALQATQLLQFPSAQLTSN